MNINFFSKFNDWFEKIQFNTKRRSKIWNKLRVDIKAGSTPVESFSMMWEHLSDDGKRPNDISAKIITEWRKKMSNGMKLSEAIHGYVPESEETIIAAGEESDLVQAIEDLLKIQKAKNRISGTIAKGVIYPFILLFAGCGFLIMFSVRVAPQFNEVLPREKWTGTAAVMADAGDFFTKYLVLLVLIGLGIFIAVGFSMPRWTGKARIFFDKIPPWTLYRLYSGCSFMLILSSMLSAGSSTTEILSSMRKTASPWLDERLAATERFVIGGKNIGDALYETGYDYPAIDTVRDLRSYASKADFAGILRKLGDEWIEDSILKVEKQSAIIKNIALVFAATIIGGFLLSIFSLEQQVIDSQH